MSEKHGRICVWSLGFAFAIIWCLALLGMGIAATVSGYGKEFVKLIGSFYVGYEATYVGSLIGCVWGFFDALFFGVILGLLYNVFTGNCCKCKCKH